MYFNESFRQFELLGHFWHRPMNFTGRGSSCVGRNTCSTPSGVQVVYIIPHARPHHPIPAARPVHQQRAVGNAGALFKQTAPPHPPPSSRRTSPANPAHPHHPHPSPPTPSPLRPTPPLEPPALRQRLHEVGLAAAAVVLHTPGLARTHNSERGGEGDAGSAAQLELQGGRASGRRQRSRLEGAGADC